MQLGLREWFSLPRGSVNGAALLAVGLLAAAAVLLAYCRWLTATEVTLTSHRARVSAGGWSREVRWSDVEQVGREGRALVLAVRAGASVSERRGVLYALFGWELGAALLRDRVGRLACPGLADAGRALDELRAAGLLAEATPLATRPRSCWAALVAAVGGALALAGGLFGLWLARAIEAPARITLSVALLTLALTLLPALPALRALRALWPATPPAG